MLQSILTIINSKKINTFSLIVLILLLLPLNAFQQKKNFTYKQIFELREPLLTAPLPRITGWLDDEYYLERKTVDDSQVIYKVSAATGEESIYTENHLFLIRLDGKG